MKCFLHIGTPKTATTTIQKFLDLNRENLLQRGFVYTKSAGKVNNRSLPITAYNLDRFDDRMKRLKINSGNELIDFQKKVINDLRTEISDLTKGLPNYKIIFSSEHIQLRLTTIEEITRLKGILFDLGLDDISVIVYLRKQSDHINSLFSTDIKEGSTAKLPPHPNNPEIFNLLNHKITLKKFGTVFGESALIPKIFEKDEFKDGSIIKDFLSILGIPMDTSYRIPDNANESLSVLGINILRRLNENVPQFIGDNYNPLRADIRLYFEKHFSDEKYIMPHCLYEQYDLVFHESNEWVRQKYFPQKRPYSKPRFILKRLS
jgi:hypothetical protein